jgi:hypothetical protein
VAERAFYDPDHASMCDKAAALENSIDLASANWVTDFTPLGLNGTGSAKLYPDARVSWMRNLFGSLQGKTVLELGSFEGAHSIQFSEAGCKEVVGIEANEAHFLKSLIIQNAVGAANVRFLLGDFQKYMETCDRRFDLVSACGVLYHMTNPGKLLSAASKISDAIFIWTVIYNEEAIPDGHRRLISGKVTLDADGLEYEGYKHFYRSMDAEKAKKDKNFSGGLDSYAVWLERDALLSILGRLGFTRFDEKLSPPTNPRHGQNILLLARR